MTVLIVLVILGWTFGFVHVVLGRILRNPGRNVRVSVRLLPWPRMEIEVWSLDGEPDSAHIARTGGRVDRYRLDKEPSLP